MNYFTLSGRLTANPESKVTSTGKNMCKFTLAVMRYGKPGVKDYINITCFDSSAKYITTYLKKDDWCIARGQIRYGKWIGRDGVERKELSLLADEIEGAFPRLDDEPFENPTPPQERKPPQPSPPKPQVAPSYVQNRQSDADEDDVFADE